MICKLFYFMIPTNPKQCEIEILDSTLYVLSFGITFFQCSSVTVTIFHIIKRINK